MDSVQAAKDQASRIQKIQEKYGRMMEEIAKIQKFIDEAPTKYADRSAEFIDDKLAVANAKIAKCKKQAEDWLNAQLSKADAWVKEEQQKITDQVERTLTNLVEGKSNF